MTVARWDRYPDRASARRAAAREFHPDRGGSPGEFAAALDAIDVHFRQPRPHSSVRRRRRRTFSVNPLRLLRRRRRFIEL
ncbi:hypothetical protein ASD37_26405 [Mycobacterium sp. Root135]|uniref:hypothetical protein n=1 Tax=Mycobacterium sp. Root135 TaxID=1736457 RepID=UPI0006FF585B|nr:hypothetical protein [Mycobacterium sp. Root135]KQY03059.1 hypothetical protein ASD37_26405 [Mycobacterium sp. Root135]